MGILLTLVVAIPSQAQFLITYKSHYFSKQDNQWVSIDPGVSDHIYQEYFVTDGYYVSFIAGTNTRIDMYDGSKNERTDISIHGDISTSKAVQTDSGIRVSKISPIDTAVTILGHSCKGIRVHYNEYFLDYYYNEKFRINPESFAQHTYIDWNKVVDAMDGSIPLQFIVYTENTRSIHTAISVEEVEKDLYKDSPKDILKGYTKRKNDHFKEIIDNLTSQHKELKPVTSFELAGNAILNNFKFNSTLKYKKPVSMILKLMVNEAEFLYSYREIDEWEYDPMSDKVKLKEHSTKKSAAKRGNNDMLGAFNPVLKDDWNAYKPLFIKEFDSTYFLLLHKDYVMEQYIIDKQTLLISKWGNEVNNYLYSDYTMVNNTPFPAHIKQLNFETDKPEFEFQFDDIKLNPAIPDSTFAVPHFLKDKIIIQKEEEKTSAEVSDQVYFDKAEDFMKSEQYDSAIWYYKETIKVNDGKSLYHNQLGLAYLKKKENYLAIASFMKALEISENNDAARGNLGYCKMIMGDYKKAIADFTLAMEIDSTDRNHTSNRGISYYKLEEYALAQKDFERTIKIDPDYGLAYWNTAMCQYNLKDFENAIPNFTKALELDKDNMEAFNYRGICYYRLEKFEQAAIDFKKATTSKKPLVNYFGNLGDTYLKLDNKKLAMRAFEDGVAYDSAYHKGYNNIGLIYLQDESFDAAIEAFSQAISINPKDAGYFDNRALAKSGKMDFAGAIEDFSESISLYPKDANTFYLRGMAKINLNNKFDGCKDLKKASEMGNASAGEALTENCSAEN